MPGWNQEKRLLPKGASVYKLLGTEERLEPYTGGYDHLIHLAGQDTLFHVACLLGRPGALWYLAKLEHDQFPPGTPLNERLAVSLVHWPPETPLSWYVATVPMECRHQCYGVATALGLRLARPGAHPANDCEVI